MMRPLTVLATAVVLSGVVLAVRAAEPAKSDPKPETSPEAKAACIPAKSVTRWEPIDGWRALAHAGDKPLAFVDLNVFQGGPYFARNGEPAVRLFSSRLCIGDFVQVNGRRGRVINFEFVREN
jgi:hypothetical protein